MDFLQITLWALAALIFFVVAAYLISRAASYAHFRTRLEYFRTITREEEPKNGK